MIEISTTKVALASSMKKLMEVKSVAKISIKDITDLCGLNRKSFYYHFKDKYELVNWIFYTEFVMTIKDENNNDSLKLLERVCYYLYENKTFYRNAFKIEGQNSFSDYFVEIIEPVIYIYLEDLFKNADNKEIFTKYLADATRSIITKWILEDDSLPPQDFIKLMKTSIEKISILIVNNLK